MTQAELDNVRCELVVLKRRIAKLDAMLHGDLPQSSNDVESEVCKEFGITKKLLMSPFKDRHIVVPRQIAMFIRRRHLCQTLQAIARVYGKHHSAVLHAVNCIQAAIETEPAIAAAVNRIARKFKTC